MQKAFNVALASALVHLYSPKHHPRALRLLDEVLKFDPNNVDALIGRGYVLQHAGKWEEAESFFTQATSLIPPGTTKSVRAKEESAWCLSKVQIEKGLQALKEVLNDLQGDECDMDRARCLWRVGKCCWEMGGWSILSVCVPILSYFDRSRLPGRSILSLYQFSEVRPDICSCIHFPWYILLRIYRSTRSRSSI